MADEITFVGSSCTLDLQVREVTEEGVTVEMKRAEIDRLLIGVSGNTPFGDRLSVQNCSDEFEVKLVSMSAGAVVLRLPRNIVATAEIRSGPQPRAAKEVQRNSATETTVTEPEAARSIVVPSVVEHAHLGSLHGRMLTNGKPFAGCKVKVRRLQTSGFFINEQEPQVFEATTDEQGIYRFEQLPEGPYDIYWMPPGQDYWVRLLREAPTVMVGAGKEVVQPDINADMRVM